MISHKPQERIKPTVALGDKIREARQAARLTQGDVARAIGCGVSYVSDMELGQRQPSREHAALIALKVGADWLNTAWLVCKLATLCPNATNGDLVVAAEILRASKESEGA